MPQTGREPSGDDVLMAAGVLRCRGRLRVPPREVRVPRRGRHRPAFRRRAVDEEPDVVVQLAGGPFRLRQVPPRMRPRGRPPPGPPGKPPRPPWHRPAGPPRTGAGARGAPPPPPGPPPPP